MTSTTSGTWPRLIAEFVVIVVGVLVALGVDSHVSWRNDRRLEQEYLERLYEDVQYDLAELDFIEEVSEAALAYLDTLSNAETLLDVDDTRLLAAIRVASISREPDLSRSTFRELVSSGRIGLIRSRAVRTELAGYDRIIEEMAGFWSKVDIRFRDWVTSRISFSEMVALNEACGSLTKDELSTVTWACPFSASGRSAATLRTEIGTPEVQRLLSYQTNRVGSTAQIARLLRMRALSLQDLLAGELRTVRGAS
jgi:hypothetical protein